MHGIIETDGRVGMAYTGEVPWHGLGNELQPGSTFQVWLEAAGLDFEILSSPIEFNDGEDNVLFPDRVALYRSDNSHPLSIVSPKYNVVQPAEVLHFFEDLVAAADFELETAGTLFNGEKIWALARTGQSFRLMGQDEVKGYLLLATSCDKSMQTIAKFTSIRVVCNNTLHVATTSGEPQIKVPHSRVFDADAVKQQLGITKKAWSEFSDIAETLASRKVKRKEVMSWLIDTFGDPKLPEDEQPNQRIMQSVFNAMQYAPGSGLRSSDGTAWGLVNAATYHVDHLANTRTSDARLDKAFFGKGAAMKQKALASALKLVA